MKSDYLTRLSRYARWYLSRAEAEEVIADYQDIVGQPPRSDRELVQALGRPGHVVKLLVQPKKYLVWLVVFAVLAVCLVRAASVFLPGGWLFYPVLRSDLERRPEAVPLLLGTALALLWFRGKGNRTAGALPRSVLPVLAVLLAGIAGVWWCAGQTFRYPNGIVDGGYVYSPLHYPAHRPLAESNIPLTVMYYFLICAVIAAVVIGITGLVKARTRDRRWAAVYVLALTLAVLSLTLAMLAFDADLGYKAFLEDWWRHYMLCYLGLTALGLVGTGAALC